jgi:integrase
MDRGKLPPYVDLYLEEGFWKLRIDLDSTDARGFEDQVWRDPASIGPATGPDRLTRKEVQRVAWENFLARLNPVILARKSAMTITEFVESKFVPEHVAQKGLAGRTHYQAILKHVLTPEEVQRIFQVDTERSRSKLKAVHGWPYLSNLRLSQVQGEHVEKLMIAAEGRRYSTQTVTHIRNVVSAIYSHARKVHCYHGENPASQVPLPDMNRKEAHALTLSQAKAVLGMMRYPEREMTLTAFLTSMNVAEICGLQWKCVNLSASPIESEGQTIPARTLAVRKQWYRGELSEVKRIRERHLPIPDALLPMFQTLKSRARYVGPEDFVFVSQAGTPINETNVASRRLKALGDPPALPGWQ